MLTIEQLMKAEFSWGFKQYLKTGRTQCFFCGIFDIPIKCYYYNYMKNARPILVIKCDGKKCQFTKSSKIVELEIKDIFALRVLNDKF